ncbi:MAG: hypothetical protein ACK51F_16290 [Rhodospirillales bacterium]|jgi:hypothetical protein
MRAARVPPGSRGTGPTPRRAAGAPARRSRILPSPANDNPAPPLARIARAAALAIGIGAIAWVAARLLAP